MIKKHNPRFCITFHIKDLLLVKIILKNKYINKIKKTIEERRVNTVYKENYELIMKKIVNFFKINLSIRSQKSTGNSYLRLVVTNKLSKSILINYLTNYSLYSSKFLNY